MAKKTVKDVEVRDKRVFVRVDYNVPMKEGVIRDDTRIQASLPTVKYLVENGAKVILASHMGRPDGQRVDSLSLKPVAERLSELIGKKVLMLNDCIGEEVEKAVAEMKSGDVVMLENLRFYKEETKNNPEFAAKLAKLAEIYVDDAFGTAHRAHASTRGAADLLPVRVSGFLMEKELVNLGMITGSPVRPFTAILGGAKVKDKVAVIKNLLTKVDNLIIGGGMAFSFLKAQGYEVGNSLLDENIEPAKEILAEAAGKNVNILLSCDVVIADEVKQGSPYSVVNAHEIPEGKCGVDIGPETVKVFSECLAKSKTIFWNGPMGVFEIPEFAKGTLAIAEAIAESGAISCIGGGDSVAAVKQLGFGDKMTHLSTGGGASLEFIEGKELPGVTILDEKKNSRISVIAGNWKLNKKISEAVELASALKDKVGSVSDREVVICPVFTSLYPVNEVIKGSSVKLGAQDVYHLEQGAYTGEVAPGMLKDAGCDYVIIGHSERRAYFGETDETVNQKIKAAFEAGLTPIVCVGESLEQKEQGITKSIVAGQVKGALAGLSAELVSKVIIAYEPIWAIGTGKTDSPEGAEETIASIRAEIKAQFGAASDDVRILYGGSVKPANVDDLMKQPDIDGALVGGASLKADSFERIVMFQ